MSLSLKRDRLYKRTIALVEWTVQGLPGVHFATYSLYSAYHVLTTVQVIKP